MTIKYPFIVQDIDNSYVVLYAEGIEAKNFDTKKEAQKILNYI